MVTDPRRLVKNGFVFSSLLLLRTVQWVVHTVTHTVVLRRPHPLQLCSCFSFFFLLSFFLLAHSFDGFVDLCPHVVQSRHRCFVVHGGRRQFELLSTPQKPHIVLVDATQFYDNRCQICDGVVVVCWHLRGWWREQYKLQPIHYTKCLFGTQSSLHLGRQ